MTYQTHRPHWILVISAGLFAAFCLSRLLLIVLPIAALGFALWRRSLRGREVRLRRAQARAIRRQVKGKVSPEDADGIQADLDARFEALRTETDRRSRAAQLRAWTRTGVGSRPRLDTYNAPSSEGGA